ncbi:uncharacterized protein F4807DRAFT_462617 [Annulohypoxylon truncatum]|uniref:uncharacterized protein n=1 Tax=Annulohypoxylon truncatum TaxID=327061 RepID=UPI0020086266|nr:uncharacterized protein F4807DRAFT_462617 [Annulohypoxylon truncatum]KAI1207464.1 hypothetical protein F4807DRAFT_462617 [Annulohypoxylon truncatum]
MAAAQAVLGCAELLDLILRDVPSHQLPILQCVSRFWQAVITETPVHRRSIFLDSPLPVECPVAERYVKNSLVAFQLPTLFAMTFRHSQGIWRYRHEHIPQEVIPMRIASAVRNGQGPAWMAGRSQWDQMHVALPAITSLRWEITRDDRANTDYLDVLPCAVAELKFPRGLRVGEVWDLTTAMRGVVKMMWPEVKPSRIRAPLTNYSAEYQWRADSYYAANRSRTLIIQQYVTDEDAHLGDVPVGVESDDEEHPNRDSLYSGLPFDVIFDGHQIPVPKVSVLEDAQDDAVIPWVYTEVNGGEVDRLTALAQTPSVI